VCNVFNTAPLPRYAAGMTTQAPATAGMRRRSVYLAAEVADRLDEAVADIHFGTRWPKHEVLAAAVAVALEHRAEIEARLAGTEENEE